jgi:chitin-binding protein
MSWIRRLLVGGTAATGVLVAAAVPASAHGTLFGPVSRVAACYAEGPENPQSQVCKDLVAATGTQPLYDWNEVNIANADGQSQQIIPDGHLCSANRDKYRALDWARTDWAATAVSAGAYTFKFRVTAAHQGVMTLYITKAGYDPTQPLKWSDLDLADPVAQYATGRDGSSGYYTFNGTLPSRSGRQLIYMVWQRTDSPEAFYACSDVVYGSGAAAGTVLRGSVPTERQLAAGAARSTVDHHGHGSDALPLDTAVPAGLNRRSAPVSPAMWALTGFSAVAATGSGVLLYRRRTALAGADS